MAAVRYGREEIEIIDRAAAWIAAHPDERWRDHPARCFVLVETGPGGHLVHRAYERRQFLRLVARVRREKGRLTRRQVAKLLGLLDRSAPLVGRDVKPAGEAVVLARGKVVGAWVEERGRQPRALAKRELPRVVIEGVNPPLGTRLYKVGGLESLRYAPPRMRRHRPAPEPHPEELAEHHKLERAQRKKTPVEEVIRRTPHIRLPAKPIEPGQRFKVKVFTDASKKPAPGEEAEEIVIVAPADQDSFETLVWLVPSDHFTVRSESIGHITVERAVAKSAPLEFEVEAKKSLRGIEGVPALSATFLYQGRPAGKVTREVRLVGAEPPRARGAVSKHFELQSLAPAPDVTVVISRSSSGQSYHCLVEAPDVPGFECAVKEPWGMREGAEAVVAKTLKSFTAKGLSANRRRARLRGAGVSLFKKSPQNVQDVFNALNRAGVEGCSVLIATEEAAMPWELLIASGRKQTEPAPLGVSHVVSRWTHPEFRCSFPPFKLEQSGIVAPKYKEGRELKWSGRETTFVRTNLKGKRINPATFDSLDEKLAKKAPSLLHFICHGAAGEGPAETIWLDDDETLTSEELLGMPGVRKACAATHPIVFMNACEVGRSVPALIGANGFAQSFIELGARAVIAPIWSVKDGLAHETAVDFYTAALKDRERPLADILREIRAKTYQGEDAEDTYAAYCFFGDPLLPLRPRKR